MGNVLRVRATTRSLPRRACPAPVAVPRANALVVPGRQPVPVAPVPVVRVRQPALVAPVRPPVPVVPARAHRVPPVPVETVLLRA
jgi:hypothetical protein